MQAFLKSRLTAIHALSAANASVPARPMPPKIFMRARRSKLTVFPAADVFRPVPTDRCDTQSARIRNWKKQNNAFDQKNLSKENFNENNVEGESGAKPIVF